MRSTPGGVVSLNCTFVSGVALGLVTVTVMIERPPSSTVDGLNDLVIDAGTACAKASPVKDAVTSAAAIAASVAPRPAVHALPNRRTALAAARRGRAGPVAA